MARLTPNHKVKANPSEDFDPVVVVDAEEVHHDHGHRHQHPHEAYCEEELGRHEESCKAMRLLLN